MPVSAGVFFCAGDERKCNWLLVRPVPGAQRSVIFFPGDISDFAASDSPYSYSLEALLWVLCCKFPDDTIVVVKPHMMVNNFAIYVNFMLVDSRGNPRPLQELHARKKSEDDGDGTDIVMSTDNDDEVGHGDSAGLVVQPPRAVAHLEKLLSTLEHELGGELPNTFVLVGFSKGAAVINALLRESGEAAFWKKVENVHFLDAGLMVPGVFPVQSQALQALNHSVGEGFAIWLHGTPRQLQDLGRPFIVEETNAFVERCKDAGLRVEQRTYAEGQPPSLNMHFDTVRCFLTHTGDTNGGDGHCGFFQTWAAAVTVT